MSSCEFTHFDEQGNAVMVDVTDKPVTERMAQAEGTIHVSPEVIEAIRGHRVKKGDVLTVAQVAGIMGTKKTSELIPMSHLLNLTGSGVTFTIQDEDSTIHAVCTAKTAGRTGVEMEALTGVTAALLTIYDMCKAIDRRMCITDVHLVGKHGGRSGDFYYADTPAPRDAPPCPAPGISHECYSGADRIASVYSCPGMQTL